MFEKLKAYLHQRRIEAVKAEIKRVRALRMSMTQQEFNLRGKLAVLEASA